MRILEQKIALLVNLFLLFLAADGESWFRTPLVRRVKLTTHFHLYFLGHTSENFEKKDWALGQVGFTIFAS